MRGKRRMSTDGFGSFNGVCNTTTNVVIVATFAGLIAVIPNNERHQPSFYSPETFINDYRRILLCGINSSSYRAALCLISLCERGIQHWQQTTTRYKHYGCSLFKYSYLLFMRCNNRVDSLNYYVYLQYLHKTMSLG